MRVRCRPWPMAAIVAAGPRHMLASHGWGGRALALIAGSSLKCRLARCTSPGTPPRRYRPCAAAPSRSVVASAVLPLTCLVQWLAQPWPPVAVVARWLKSSAPFRQPVPLIWPVNIATWQGANRSGAARCAADNASIRAGTAAGACRTAGAARQWPADPGRSPYSYTLRANIPP